MLLVTHLSAFFLLNFVQNLKLSLSGNRSKSMDNFCICCQLIIANIDLNKLLLMNVSDRERNVKGKYCLAEYNVLFPTNVLPT